MVGSVRLDYEKDKDKKVKRKSGKGKREKMDRWQRSEITGKRKVDKDQEDQEDQEDQDHQGPEVHDVAVHVAWCG